MELLILRGIILLSFLISCVSALELRHVGPGSWLESLISCIHMDMAGLDHGKKEVYFLEPSVNFELCSHTHPVIEKHQG